MAQRNTETLPKNLGDIRHVRLHLQGGVLLYLQQVAIEIDTYHRGVRLFWRTERSVVADHNGRYLKGGDVQFDRARIEASVDLSEDVFEAIYKTAKEA